MDGIEPNPSAAAIAKAFYRNFYCSIFQEIKESIILEDYDFIVMADVIEHIIDPFIFLSELIEGLSNKTKIILSIPNVAHYSVRLELFSGQFRYVDSGLLEKTHVRFFTFETIEDLIRNIGLSVDSMYYLRRIKNPVLTMPQRLSWLCYLRLIGNQSALTYQYLHLLGRSQVERREFVRGRISFLQILRLAFSLSNGPMMRMFNYIKCLSSRKKEMT